MPLSQPGAYSPRDYTAPPAGPMPVASMGPWPHNASKPLPPSVPAFSTAGPRNPIRIITQQPTQPVPGSGVRHLVGAQLVRPTGDDLPPWTDSMSSHEASNGLEATYGYHEAVAARDMPPYGHPTRPTGPRGPADYNPPVCTDNPFHAAYIHAYAQSRPEAHPLDLGISGKFRPPSPTAQDVLGSDLLVQIETTATATLSYNSLGLDSQRTMWSTLSTFEDAELGASIPGNNKHAPLSTLLPAFFGLSVDTKEMGAAPRVPVHRPAGGSGTVTDPMPVALTKKSSFERSYASLSATVQDMPGPPAPVPACSGPQEPSTHMWWEGPSAASRSQMRSVIPACTDAKIASRASSGNSLLQDQPATPTSAGGKRRDSVVSRSGAKNLLSSASNSPPVPTNVYGTPSCMPSTVERSRVIVVNPTFEGAIVGK
jgi:hypothetical protein